MDYRALVAALVFVAGCNAFADDGEDETPAADPPAEEPAEPAPPVGPVLGAPSGDPVAGAAACEAVGGTCTGISSCSRSAGHMSNVSCESNAGVVCCIQPADSCGGVEDFLCCGGGMGLRPFCADGELKCKDGYSKVPLDGKCG